MRKRISAVLTASWQVAWIALLVSLPVTSFPLLARWLGDTQVAPLALFPLAWLVLAWLPSIFFKSSTRLPAETRPLFGFVFVALLSSLAAFFIDSPPYKSHTIASNELSAFLTLGVGLGFYLATVTFVRSAGMERTIKFISIGGIVLLLCSLAQGVVVWFLGHQYPGWMVDIHSWFVSTSLLRLFPQMRVTGLAYEPSWLAHMLTILYLPLWMAGCRCRQSAFRFRLGRFILEDLLLLCALVILFMTFSRISLLAFVLALGWFVYHVVKSASWKVFSRLKVASRSVAFLRLALSILVIMLFFVAFTSLIFGLAFFDPRLAPVFQLGEQVVSAEFFRDGLLPLANRLNFAERVVFWDLGWQVFRDHPLLGVGLGNAGQYTLRDLSPWGWELIEVRRILVTETFLPNTKNLWIRLLSETGMVGFVFFVAWLMLLWHAARALRSGSQRFAAAIGLAGQLAIIALVVEGFSLDTFALPYWWVMLGLLTAASFLRRAGDSPAAGEGRE